MDHSVKSILKMLEEGRITAQEAERLMDELSKSNKDGFGDKIDDFKDSINDIANELNDKLEELSKEYTPKVKKTVQDLGKKTSALLKDLSDELNKRF